ATQWYLRLEALEYRFLGRVEVLGVALPYPLCHRGFDVARTDGVDRDTRLREFKAQRLGESDDAVLGGGIGSAEHHALLAAGRRDVDYPSPAALKQLPRLEHLASHQEDAVQVGVDNVVPELVADFRCHAAA